MHKRLSREKIRSIEEKASLYIRTKRLQAAEKLLMETLDREPGASNINLLLANLYQIQSNYPKAIEQLSKAINSNPNFLEASITLCNILCDLGQYEEANQQYQKIYQEKTNKGSLPKTVRGRLANLHAENGKIYEKTGLTTEAAGEYIKALTLFSDMPDIRLKLAKILINQGHIQKAKRELSILLDSSPNDGEALAFFGIALYREGQVDEARDQWKRSLQLDPENPISKSYSQLISENSANTGTNN